MDSAGVLKHPKHPPPHPHTHTPGPATAVSWEFIHKTLDYFDGGPSFKRWNKLFQNGSKSCILQNGHTTANFVLQMGCRQGDPISPDHTFLFSVLRY